MSDTIEDLKSLKEFRISERNIRAEVNIELLKELNIPVKEQSKNVFRINTRFGAVMYYPSSEKWQHKGRVHFGDIVAFRAWLKKEKFL